MASIVEFPKNKIVRDTTTQTNERLAAAKEAGVRNFAEAVVSDIAEEVAMNFSSCGINIETEQFQRDFTLLYSVMLGTVYRAVDLTHPMLGFMDKAIVLADELPDEKQAQLPFE